jgi:hypothetical protein
VGLCRKPVPVAKAHILLLVVKVTLAPDVLGVQVPLETTQLVMLNVPAGTPRVVLAIVTVCAPASVPAGGENDGAPAGGGP